jgi:prepilin-type N-terminal cleavage/methylation domain-containing protein
MISEKKKQKILERGEILRSVNGFTLVELLLVLVIIGVFTGGVVVSLKGRQNHYALNVSSNDLAEAIRYAAYESRMREMPHRVVFRNERSYRVEKQQSGFQGNYMPVTGVAGRVNTLKGNVRIAGFFNRDGKALVPVPESVVFDQSPNTFSGRICLQEDLGRTVVIVVNGVSGQVGIDE